MTTMTAGRIADTRRPTLKALFRAWLEKRRDLREKRKAIAELKGLDRAMLRDIGIDASEITSIVHSQPEIRRMSHDRV